MPSSCSGVEPRRDGQTAIPWFELECAGTDSGHPEGAGARRPPVDLGLAGTRSSAIFDLDGDGDLDIVTNEFNAEPMVLLSDLPERRRPPLPEDACSGRASNRGGLGATVTVTAAG